MERAGRALTRLKLSRLGVEDEQLARAAWPVAVGTKVARHTTAMALVRSRLVVHVEDKIWQRQLWGLREQILTALRQALDRGIVEELEFRIAGPQRKPPQVAPPPAVFADEADQIRDPMFRSIYKTARRKANG